MSKNTKEIYYKQPKNHEEYLVSVNILPKIKRKFESLFTVLELPEVVDFQKPNSAHPQGMISFKKYKGETFNDVWNEFDGGKDVPFSLAHDIVSLIKDLKKINIEYVLGLGELQTFENYSFDLKKWSSEFVSQLDKAKEIGFNIKDLEEALKFIGQGFSDSKQIFNNGDLYPRNLIRTEKSLVLIDWEYWTDGRAFYIDEIENVIAFVFIHMWGNKLWQDLFLQIVKETFNLNQSNLKRAVLIKSLSQAFFFHKHNLPTDPQIQMFKKALVADM